MVNLESVKFSLYQAISEQFEVVSAILNFPSVASGYRLHNVESDELIHPSKIMVLALDQFCH